MKDGEDFKLEFADDDKVDVRYEKICKVVNIVDPELDLGECLVTDLSSLFDFCLDPTDEIKQKLKEVFYYDFDSKWFSAPLWELIDYIDLHVGWPDDLH